MIKKQIDCRACGNCSAYLQGGIILQESIQYFECDKCGYVQTQYPDWLDKAYSDTINTSDTGLLARNQFNSRVVLGTLMLLGNLSGRVVDYAGGYGILVRALRDFGVDASWMDPYCENLLAKGFEFEKGSDTILTTAFEAFEHLVNPVEDIRKMFELSPNLLVSTDLIADPAPVQSDWWYYGADHGQHIGFFRVRTLQVLADRHEKYLYTNGVNYHLFTSSPISQQLWRYMLRYNWLMPAIARRKLVSKTWADHIRLSKV